MNIDRLIRSKRKTVALVVERDGQLTVRAPVRLAMRDILAFVEQHQAWIVEKQAKAQAAGPVVPRHRYIDGETFFYLGQAYPLEIVTRATGRLRFDGKFILGQAALPRAQEAFITWYKARAREQITARVEAYAARYAFSFQKIRITSARTRWGSCSWNGTLSFTWRLVMAPLEIVDYVVVHELAHLREKNHSPRFWGQVAAILPDYKDRRAWLKAHGGQFNLD